MLGLTMQAAPQGLKKDSLFPVTPVSVAKHHHVKFFCGIFVISLKKGPSFFFSFSKKYF